MNKALLVVFGIVTWAVLLLLVFNQLRLQRLLREAEPAKVANLSFPGLEQAQRDVALISKRAADAVRELDILESRMQQFQTRVAELSPRRPRGPVTAFLPLDGPPPAVRGRAWGPEQVIGPPDTMQAGDVSTAWAPRQPDGGAEWLKVDYERETQISEVVVRETYNPGAIIRVTALLPGGEEALLWDGDEPPAQAPVDRSFPAMHSKVSAKSVKIYLDTKKVPGWNEIDAVELIGADGSRQWASGASASSSYADP